MPKHPNSTAAQTSAELQSAAISGGPLDRTRFGGKAAELAKLVTAGANVPPAFALSGDCVERIRLGLTTRSFNRSLASVMKRLVKSSPSSSVIVRSSHPLESGSDGIWNGRFRSEGEVSNFDDLLRAITGISTAARPWLRKTSENRCGALPLVIQSEVPCEFSAIVLIENDAVRLEMFRGNLAEPISGIGSPTVIVAHGNRLPSGEEYIFRIVGDQQRLGDGALELARRLLEEIPAQDATSLIEAGYHKGTWHLFQRQPITAAAGGPSRHHMHMPRKADAMLRFRDLGLFQKRLMVVSPGDAPPNHFREWKFPITIRFALGDQIGLPRYFVSSDEEAQRVLSQRDRVWTVIIHEFIEVTRSFEVLLDSDRAYLEHLPGMWESDSALRPDTLVVENTGICRSYRRVEDRTCNAAGGVAARVPPIPSSLPAQWATRLSSLLPSLRSAFALALPVNLHFVEDVGGDWHFLNSRAGFRLLSSSPMAYQEAYRIRSLADLDAWDGKRPLLLAVTTSRGHEDELDPLADRLRTIRVPLYAEFGLLSHPAMALQARGVALLPAYDVPAHLTGGYEHTQFALDRGLDPVTRIANERALYVDDYVRVVRDRDEIVPGHLLVVAKHEISSFAESPIPAASLLAGLAGNLDTGQRELDWLIYERGRARFCTSGFTGSHAHMHLVPAKAFAEGALAELARALNAEAFPDLSAAWAEAGEIDGEYLLFGPLNGETFLCRRGLAALEKRYVRRFLTERRK